MTLVNVPNAVDFLLTVIEANGFVPEQIVVEFTESEAISRFDEFTHSVRQLKSAGISVTIDHFGAGFAGLQLLAQFQPDRIKINRDLIANVHKSGPRQAIVQPSSNAARPWKSSSARWVELAEVDVAGIRRNFAVSGASVRQPAPGQGSRLLPGLKKERFLKTCT
jgi:predicted signal transduction protein with EAL and GGDEF domain